MVTTKQIVTGEVLSAFKKKTDYTVRIEKVEPGTTAYNCLEDAHYIATVEKCYMLTGCAGERWMTSEEKVLKTYDIDNTTLARMRAGESINGDFSPRKDSAVVWMRPAIGREIIETSWGEKLTANRKNIQHGKGDMVAYYSDENGEPNPNDRSVINGAVFEATYEKIESDDGNDYSFPACLYERKEQQAVEKSICG